MTPVAGDEDFVTVVLAEFHDDDTVTLVNCGHHPPLLVTAADGGAWTHRVPGRRWGSAAPHPVTSRWPAAPAAHLHRRPRGGP